MPNRSPSRPLKMACLAVLITALAACGGNDSPTELVEMYVPLGSLQCTGGGTPLPQWVHKLELAGVQVIASACGQDGKARLAVCGVADGRIAIVQIPRSQSQSAASLGFDWLSTLPDASRLPCS
jgi:hypothetical protein